VTQFEHIAIAQHIGLRPRWPILDGQAVRCTKFCDAVPKAGRLDASQVARHKERLQHDIVWPELSALGCPSQLQWMLIELDIKPALVALVRLLDGQGGDGHHRIERRPANIESARTLDIHATAVRLRRSGASLKTVRLVCILHKLVCILHKVDAPCIGYEPALLHRGTPGCFRAELRLIDQGQVVMRLAA
jgi:hypothetical protein